MRLVAFSAEYLSLDAALPFGLRDASGRLLLGAGVRIANADGLQRLRAQPLFADEADAEAWQRRVAAAMDARLRRNVALKEVLRARPDDAALRADAAPAEVELGDAWAALSTQLDAATRAAPGADWLPRVRALQARALALVRRRPDASLYRLVRAAGEAQPLYCAQHALLVLAVADEAARLLDWDEPARGRLALAALTMNATIAALQDRLALGWHRPTAAQRAAIAAHADEAAQWLQRAGADDAVWIEAVRHHHASAGANALPAAQPLAQLLQRVDVYTAKISARRVRPALSPVQAARDACLGRDGAPDAIGAALLRATGLYPPGTVVELASGERGLVVARGRRANLPWVASLVAPSGLALGEPALRDTLDARHAVRAALPAAELKVRPDDERLLALYRPPAPH